MGKGGRAREFTLSELQSHKTPGDCWFAIKGKVYDVSKWTEHPGGPVYNSVAGTDATDAFRAFHSSIGEAHLKRFEIGDLAPAALKAIAPNEFEREYRELYERVKAIAINSISTPPTHRTAGRPDCKSRWFASSSKPHWQITIFAPESFT